MSVEIKIQSEFIVTSVQKIWFDSLGSYATLFLTYVGLKSTSFNSKINIYFLKKFKKNGK
jgi:hypothetical protein